MKSFDRVDEFEQLVESFLAQARAGTSPEIEEYAARHPEFGDHLREALPTMMLVEENLSLTSDRSESIRLGEPINLPVTRQLGDYLILREIGRGGMGVVYEAVQNSLGRHVALKVLPWTDVGNSSHLERFRIEAKSAARLHHTNIVPVFGVGEHEGTHYFAMQYIRGRSLDEVIEGVKKLRKELPEPPSTNLDDTERAQSGLLPSITANLMTGGFKTSTVGQDLHTTKKAPGDQENSEAFLTESGHASESSELSELTEDAGQFYRGVATAMLQVAEAVGYAHSQGILHRDIKPSNLLMDARGTIWVTDFGLAKDEGSDGPTRTGDIVGTLRYMAPERFDGHSDPLTDLYAIGSTLYELMTLRPLFEATSRAVLIEQILRHEPESPSSIDRRVPRDLEVICLKCLSKEPSDRYGSADALAAELRRFLAGEPILARRSSLSERGWRWCRRNPALAGAVGAVTVALLAVTTMAVLDAKRQHRFAEKEAKALTKQTEATQEITRLANDLEAERGNLKVSLKETNRRLAMQFLERGQVTFEKGHISSGLLWTLAAWRSASKADDPTWRHAARASLSAWAAELPPLRAVVSQAGPLIGLTISPDGKTVVTLCDDRTGQHWDIATAMPIGPPIQWAGSYMILFSPDGKTLANTFGNLVQLLNPANGKLRSSMPAPAGARALAFSPDGSKLFIGDWNGGTQFWDLSESRSLGSLDENPDLIISSAFSPDGRTLLTGHNDKQKSMRFWDIATMKPLGPPISHPNRVTAVAFSPDGKTALTGCYDGIARFWDVATMKPVDPPLVHEGEIRLVAFTPDGKTVLTGSIDRTARLWDAATHAPVGPIYEHQGPIEGGAISPDGRWILTAGGDSTARVWKLDRDRREETCVKHKKEIRGVAFSPDGKTFLTGGYDGIAQLWDTATGRPVGPPMTHPGEVWAVAISPDGKTAATGCKDHFARLWDANTSQPRAIPLQHNNVVNLLVFSPDGKTLLTGSQDGKARLWDVATGKLLGEPLPQNGGVDAGVFSHDGQMLAIGIDLGIVRIWNMKTREMIGPPIPHPGAVSCLAFSPDDRTLFISGEDGTVRRWNLATRASAGLPMRHRAWIYAMAMSPDGGTILTGSWDKTAQLWDAATGMPIGPPFTHQDRVWTVAFSPDGKKILTGCDDRKARIFPIVPELPDDLERIGIWTEVLTGLSLDDQESVKVLNNDEWRERRDRLNTLGGPPLEATAIETNSPQVISRDPR